MRLLQIVLLAGLGVALRPAPAAACSPWFCPTVAVVPFSGVVPPGLAELRVESFGGFGVDWMSVSATPEGLLPTWRLETGQSAASSRSIALPGVLVTGQRYAVQVEQNCANSGPKLRTGELTVEEPSAPPSTLGELTVLRSGPGQVPVANGNGGCWDYESAAVVDLQLDLSFLSAGWRNVLHDYQLVVDGEPFTWSMSLAGDFSDSFPGLPPPSLPRANYLTNPGVFQVWTYCPQPLPGETVGLSPGPHTVKVRAVVPDGKGTVIESQAVEVSLRCAASDPDAGQGDDAGVVADAGTMRDAQAAASHDGGSVEEGAAEGNDASALGDSSTPGEGSDGCSLVGAGRVLSPGSLLLLAGMFAWLRRRPSH